MLRGFRSVKSYFEGKYHAFNSSDNSFVVMMFCNRFIGIFDNPGSDFDLLRPVRFTLIALVILYVQLEMGSMFFFGLYDLRQNFAIVYLVFFRQLSLIVWVSLVVHRHNLKQIWTYLLDLQRNASDERRRKYIRIFNWITVIFLMQDMFPLILFFVNGQVGSPLSFYENCLVDKSNAILSPIVITAITFMFYYSIIVVCSILPALTLEFRLLGKDFEQIFEDVRSLQETVRQAGKHWNQLERAFVSCVERHQKLLDMAAMFRRQVMTYFLIQLGTNFLAIVLSIFLYVLTRKGEDPRFAFTVLFTMANLFSLLLYGFLCDQLEEQVGG